VVNVFKKLIIYLLIINGIVQFHFCEETLVKKITNAIAFIEKVKPD